MSWSEWKVIGNKAAVQLHEVITQNLDSSEPEFRAMLATLPEACRGGKATTEPMKRKRRIHTAEFKARVALEALKGVKTINQIAQQEGVLPVQVSTLKREIQGRLPALFESGAQRRHDDEKAERDRARPERKVGQHHHSR